MKLRVLFLLLAVLLLIFIVIFSQKDIRENNKAVNYYNKGDFKAALEYFNREITKMPKNYDILNNAAGSEYKLNNFDEARSKYNLILDGQDTNRLQKSTAFYNLGNIEYQNGEFKKAADFYEQALRLNPYDMDAKHNLEIAILKLNGQESTQDNKQKDKKSNQKDRNQNQNNKGKQDSKEQKQGENSDQNSNDQQSSQTDTQNEKEKALKQRQSELEAKLQQKNEQNKGISQDQQKDETQKDKNQTLEMHQQGKKEEQKDMPASMFLNYYNDVDKNSNKLRNKIKAPLFNQIEEDW